MSISKLVILLKSIAVLELFKLHPKIKWLLLDSNLLKRIYYTNTIGQYGNKDVIRNYVGISKYTFRIIQTPLIHPGSLFY